MRAYILVLFLFYNILSNSLKIGHLYKQQMVNIKAENMISQNIPFSIKQ
jgi:N-acetylmuramic acid 6-phosphate (MurNAc-6-P) etherase